MHMAYMVWALLCVWCCTIVQSVMSICCVAMQAFNFVTALSPFSPTFDEDNQRDVRKRPAGPTQKPVYPNKPAEYLGTSNVSAQL